MRTQALKPLQGLGSVPFINSIRLLDPEHVATSNTQGI